MSGAGVVERIARGAWLAALVMAWLIPSAWALERGVVVIDGEKRTHRLHVEIARTARERAFGLMERETLAENAGMLFVYTQEQSPQGGFWMYRTRIPLDIAFLGADGEIRAIRSMTPCTSERAADCTSYTAGVPYRAALEVNAGYFEARGIDVGDRLELP